jgi:hypothetical protein
MRLRRVGATSHDVPALDAFPPVVTRVALGACSKAPGAAGRAHPFRPAERLPTAVAMTPAGVVAMAPAGVVAAAPAEAAAATVAGAAAVAVAVAAAAAVPWRRQQQPQR